MTMIEKIAGKHTYVKDPAAHAKSIGGKFVPSPMYKRMQQRKAAKRAMKGKR